MKDGTRYREDNEAENEKRELAKSRRTCDALTWPHGRHRCEDKLEVNVGAFPRARDSSSAASLLQETHPASSILSLARCQDSRMSESVDIK